MAPPDSSALLELMEAHGSRDATHYVFDDTAYWEELWSVPATDSELRAAIVRTAVDLGFGGEKADGTTAAGRVLRPMLVLLAMAGRAWRRTFPEKSHREACLEFQRRAEHWKVENPFNNLAPAEEDDEAYVPMPHTRDVFEGTDNFATLLPNIKACRNWDQDASIGFGMGATPGTAHVLQSVPGAAPASEPATTTTSAASTGPTASTPLGTDPPVFDEVKMVNMCMAAIKESVDAALAEGVRAAQETNAALAAEHARAMAAQEAARQQMQAQHDQAMAAQMEATRRALEENARIMRAQAEAGKRAEDALRRDLQEQERQRQSRYAATIADQESVVKAATEAAVVAALGHLRAGGGAFPEDRADAAPATSPAEAPMNRSIKLFKRGDVPTYVDKGTPDPATHVRNVEARAAIYGGSASDRAQVFMASLGTNEITWANDYLCDKGWSANAFDDEKWAALVDAFYTRYIGNDDARSRAYETIRQRGSAKSGYERADVFLPRLWRAACIAGRQYPENKVVRKAIGATVDPELRPIMALLTMTAKWSDFTTKVYECSTALQPTDSSASSLHVRPVEEAEGLDVDAVTTGRPTAPTGRGGQGTGPASGGGASKNGSIDDIATAVAQLLRSSRQGWGGGGGRAPGGRFDGLCYRCQQPGHQVRDCHGEWMPRIDAGAGQGRGGCRFHGPNATHATAECMIMKEAIKEMGSAAPGGTTPPPVATGATPPQPPKPSTDGTPGERAGSAADFQADRA